MNKCLQPIFLMHEQEDQRALSICNLQKTIRQQYVNAEKIMHLVKGFLSENSPGLCDIYAPEPVPVRKEGSLSIRKYSKYSCLCPYIHSHDFYEILYVHRGVCHQYVGSEMQPFTISSGSFCMLAPGSLHALGRSSDDDLIIKIAVPVNIFQKIIGDSLLHIQNKASDNMANILYIPKKKSYKAIQILHSLVEEYFLQKEYSEMAVSSYLSLLIVEFFRGQNSGSASLAELLEEYINHNLADASLTVLASNLCYNPNYLSHRIRQETGCSFTQILRRKRLEKAAMLLTTSECTVEAIADMLGYNNTSGLYKAFVTNFGIAPIEYRRQRIQNR